MRLSSVSIIASNWKQIIISLTIITDIKIVSKEEDYVYMIYRECKNE